MKKNIPQILIFFLVIALAFTMKDYSIIFLGAFIYVLYLYFFEKETFFTYFERLKVGFRRNPKNKITQTEKKQVEIKKIPLRSKITFFCFHCFFIYILLFQDIDDPQFLNYPNIYQFLGASSLLFVSSAFYLKKYKNTSLDRPNWFLLTILPFIVFFYK